MRVPAACLAVTAALMLAAGAPFAQDKPAEVGLAVYKPGEKYATDEQAGEAIDKLAGHLSGDKATFKRRGVRNNPTEALKLFKDDKHPVAVGIVSPAFYFANKDTLKLTALAEARRGNADGARYTLVGKSATENYPEGKRIATSLTAEKEWLNRVVLPAPENAKPVQWVQYDNLFDAAYEIIDGEDDAPDFVLADSISLQAIQKDDDLKVLKHGLQSELLPQDLVVEVDSRLGAAREPMLKALNELDKTDAGRKVGELIQSPTFQKPDAARLEKAGKLWARK